MHGNQPSIEEFWEVNEFPTIERNLVDDALKVRKRFSNAIPASRSHFNDSFHWLRWGNGTLILGFEDDLFWKNLMKKETNRPLNFHSPISSKRKSSSFLSLSSKWGGGRVEFRKFFFYFRKFKNSVSSTAVRWTEQKEKIWIENQKKNDRLPTAFTSHWNRWSHFNAFEFQH